jgi:hypothetical protein
MLLDLPGVGPTRESFRTVGRMLKRTSTSMSRVSSKAVEIVYTNYNNSAASQDLEANVTPANNDTTCDGDHEPRNGLSVSVTGLRTDRVNDASPPTPSSPGRQLWRNAVRSVKMHSAVVSPYEPYRQRTTSSGDRKRSTHAGEPVKAVFRSRVAALVPKLKMLETTQDLAAHQALVRDLQFSPDGKYLATSR